MYLFGLLLDKLAELGQTFVFSFMLAVFCWLGSLIVGALLSIGLSELKALRGVLRGIVAWFGVMPAIFLPKIFSEAGAPSFTVLGVTTCSYVPPLLVIALLFPVVETLSANCDDASRRFASISEIAGLSNSRRLRELVLPSVAANFMHTAAFTFPYTVLLVVIFDWAYSKPYGIGTYIQSIIQLGDIWQRMALIFIITLPTVTIYALVKIGAYWLERRYQNMEHILVTDPVSYRAQHTEQRCWGLGLIVGCVLFLLLWAVLFQDDPRPVGPVPFIQHILHLKEDIFRRDLVGSLFSGMAITLIFGLLAAVLGVIVGGLAALLANKSRIARRSFWLISTLTQAVPIFILIPIYQMLLRDRIAVVLFVAVSVSFYLAYEEFLQRIDTIPQSWKDLRSVALPNERVSRMLRSVSQWYFPMLLRFAAAAFALAAPWGILAALVSDLFLDIGGLASFAFLRHSTDLFILVTAFNVALGMMLVVYLTTRKMIDFAVLK